MRLRTHILGGIRCNIYDTFYCMGTKRKKKRKFCESVSGKGRIKWFPCLFLFLN